jgi:glycosyltransferase involved in cell wall biosynthesis
MIETSQGIRRVLMTADTIGGVWSYALELAKALSEHGVEVALATMGELPSPEQRAQARRVLNLQLYESTYKLEWMEDPWIDIERAGDWLLALENDLNPDVIHLNGYAHGHLPWNAPHLVAGHSCVLSWWKAVKGENAPPGWGAYRRYITRGLRAADFVVTPSRAMLDELHDYYGPLPACAVVANGRTRSRYRAASKEPLILAAGRLWDEAKNISVLCDIAPEIDWPIFVAGDAIHPDGGQKSLDGVQTLGRLSEEQLADYFARASIYCSPARYEPFGLSILEAALSGCALVLGDIPSLRENWNDAALFVPPDDSEGFALQLRELTLDAGRRTSLAGAAFARACWFTSERMAHGYMAVYRELVRDPAPMLTPGD